MATALVEPMLATPWPEAFDDEEWWFEVKWDGYRAVVGSFGGEVKARSRRGLDLTEPFPELASLRLPDGIVVDGEIVAFDEAGRPSFSLLQRRTGFGGQGTSNRSGVNLVVFDLLHAGESLLDRPYEERRAGLDDLGLVHPVLVPSPTPTYGSALLEAVRSQGIEGVVGKRLGSRYTPGRRSPDWRKVSIRRHLRAIVGGFTPGEGGRARTFGSLLIGLESGEGLRWIGAVGSGFDEHSLAAFHHALTDLTRDTSPFINEVVIPQAPVWVEPGIVIQVEYKEWTAENHLRAPVYKGIELADPATVTWEEEGPGSP